MIPSGIPMTAGWSRFDIETAKRIAPPAAAAIASSTPIASRRPEEPANIPAAIASPTPWQMARKRLMSRKRLEHRVRPAQALRRSRGRPPSAEALGAMTAGQAHLDRTIRRHIELRVAVELGALRVNHDVREVLRADV